jgi:serine/tyrosine/threonine adenylyltransferase
MHSKDSHTASQNTDRSAGWNLERDYATLPEKFFSHVHPTPVKQPSLVILNRHVANRLGLDPELLSEDQQIEILAGNRVPDGSFPIAQAYAGHQFGGFTMLGDGRAILLGEQRTPSGELVDVQLKGSGQTPYSRRGDGRASLGPMLREYIISHAMHALRIPSTLSLSVVQTGEPVVRYEIEPGAVLTRIASSHIRVGTFQYAAALNNTEHLRALADYTIQRHYPDLVSSENQYFEFLRAVIDRQAALVAQWMHVGFIHGVMNTDNVSIAGETIDYGPCAFMNRYSPCTVFSSIDEQGRYSFGNQPGICQWNLTRFAESLLPLLDPEQQSAIQIAIQAISEFPALFREYWLSGMRSKLGLTDAEEGDQALADDLLSWMETNQMDYTSTFRDLTMGRLDDAAYQDSEFSQWSERWKNRLANSGIQWEEAQRLMQNCNPVVVPRNHRVEEALGAAVQDQDWEPLGLLLEALARPFEELPTNQPYRDPSPEGDAGYRTFCGT